MGAGRREKRGGEKDGKKGIVTKPRYSKDGSHECGREGSGDCGRVATEISGASKSSRHDSTPTDCSPTTD